MKNSIVIKFLAVLLCAASLLGIIGGAAGALVLAEGDLYKKNVDEMLADQSKEDAARFAEQTALAYASRELGGCPEDMVQPPQWGFPGKNTGVGCHCLLQCCSPGGRKESDVTE